jgi:uncharacterized coiled-coil protein SlyX
MRERERLISRIRQIRRIEASPQKPSASVNDGPLAPRVDALEARMAHLEQLLEGLQDSVHREAERQTKVIAELQAQVRPATMGAALRKDARDRGL